LREVETELTRQAQQLGLAALPVWQTMQQELPAVDASDPFGAAPVLVERIQSIEALIARFESGEFLDCSFGDGRMAVVTVSPRAAESLSVSPLAVVMASDHIETVRRQLAGQHCVAQQPVSGRELRAWGNSLSLAQGSVRAEAAAVVDGPGGAAVNISHFLAIRYVEDLSRQTGRRVCIAPAEVLAEAVTGGPPPGFVTVPSEITGSPCDPGVLLNRVVQLDTSNPQAEPVCTNVSTRLPNTTFRLAMGDICANQ